MRDIPIVARHFQQEITLIRIVVAAFCSLALTASAQQISVTPLELGQLADDRGYINVWQLRDDVMKVEAVETSNDTDRCYPEGDPDAPPPSRKERLALIKQEKACVKRIQEAFAKYQTLRESFNKKWQGALRDAVRLGDPVAEVIWRQCKTTQVIERSVFASTCDDDQVRRREAGRRLREIGFDAAFDEEAEGNSPAWQLDQNKRRTLSQARTNGQMAAGVYGEWSIDNHHGGNAPYSPGELEDIRRAAVIDAASTMVRRSFTYVRIQGGYDYESHAQLRLNRKPLGTSTLAWSANVFHSGSPYTGPYDPAWDGLKVYLNYDKHREIIVGGRQDAKYLRMLHETLTRSEQRIVDWLKRDPRWSVFLLHRRGHHEWVPEGMESSLGRLNPAWGGEWVLEKRFVNFKPVVSHAPSRLRVRVGDTQTIAQIEEDGTPTFACELRYSGATSQRPEDDSHAKTATSTALGYLPALAPISPHDAGPVEPFAPLNSRKVYRQVLVQCPQGEWPDNRNKRFLFLANDTLVEVRKEAGSRDLEIFHWKRTAPLDESAKFKPLAPLFDLKPTLDWLAKAAESAEQADARFEQLRAKVGLSNADELIASLTQLRLEKSFYDSSRDFPDNLVKLIDTPDISTKICSAYRANPPDALQRFNFMVVLNVRARKQLLTPAELAIVPDCLRLALNDRDAWVRLEAVDAFAGFAEEKDRAKLTELKNDSNEDVRRYGQNALIRLKTGKGPN